MNYSEMYIYIISYDLQGLHAQFRYGSYLKARGAVIMPK